MIGIAVFLAGAAPIVVPASPMQPAASDEQVWALVQRVGSKDAYFLYLDRFLPGGAHVEEAFAALRALGVATAPPAPPPPPVPPAPPITPMPTAPRDPCLELIVDQGMGRRDTAEGRAYTAVRASNRVSAYRAFLSATPGGVCAGEARDVIEARARLRQQIHDIPGLGPLAPRRVSPRALTASAYPPEAIRKEQQGTVAAEWAVAEDGIVEDCHVVRSSGYAELDRGTCVFVTLRYRYDPARDAAGRPVRASGGFTFQWVLAPESPPALPPHP